MDDDLDMPQPLTRVKKLTKGRRSSPFLLMGKPEFALRIMGVIEAWSHTEIAMGRILANCLRAESSAGIAMYLSLSGGPARRAALQAAAERKLPKKKLALFNLVMKAIKPVRDRRNDFVHGVWWHSDEMPDALLWTSGDINLEKYEKSLKKHRSDDEDIMVYKIADLDRALGDAEDAVACVHGIGVLIHRGHAHAHEQTLKQLLARPLIVRCGGLPTTQKKK